MENTYLHAVIVKKPMPLALARMKAQKFIKNGKKTFFRETDDSWRFRNLPKNQFKDFIVQEVNEEMTIVVGHLKNEEGKPDS
jgi:hypothetical protein